MIASKTVLNSIRYLDSSVEKARLEIAREASAKADPLPAATKFFFWTLAMGFVLGVIAVLAYQGAMS